MSNRSFEGELAVVTGASRGIGHAIAFDLAEHGAFVAGTATTAEGARVFQDELADNGLEGIGIELNLAQPETFQERMTKIAEAAGKPVSILVNNAGINRDTIAVRMSDEQWDEVIDTDLSGTFKLTRSLLRPMMKAKKGRVVSIGSVVGVRGEYGQANYAAAKAGLEAMTKSLAKEYGEKGMRFNVVSPGLVDTDMTRKLPPEVIQTMLDIIPIHRALLPQEIAEKVHQALLDEDPETNGQTIAIDGGLTDGMTE